MTIRKRRLKILVVDDHELFRSGLAYTLKEIYDAEVGQEETGSGALERAASGFDLVLMDINMPGLLDGLEACAEILRRALAVRVVLMTADATPERRERAKALGATLLTKPIDLKILERILLACVGGQQS